MALRTYDEICADIAKAEAETNRKIRRATLVFAIAVFIAIVGLSLSVTYVRHVGLKNIAGDVWNGKGGR